MEWFLADMGYDGDWLRNLLKSMGIPLVILGRKNRIKAVRPKNATRNATKLNGLLPN